MSDFLRGEDDEVASFFAFQDVITAVLGILILIALQLSFSINVVSAESGNEISDSGADRISEEEFKEAQRIKWALGGPKKGSEKNGPANVNISIGKVGDTSIQDSVVTGSEEEV